VIGSVQSSTLKKNVASLQKATEDAPRRFQSVYWLSIARGVNIQFVIPDPLQRMDEWLRFTAF